MRRLAFGVAVAVTVMLFAACADDDGSAPGAPTTGRTSDTGATPTGSTGGTGGTGATGSPTPPETAPLEDGDHFGFIQRVDPGDSAMRFDLAYFLTGDEANEAAAERGDEVPVPNDYYIVNDNPRIRKLTLAPDVQLVLLDWTRCCDETFSGDLEAFARAFEEGSSVEAGGYVYQGPLSPYWLSMRDGEVVRIEEQYLP